MNKKLILLTLNVIILGFFDLLSLIICICAILASYLVSIKISQLSSKVHNNKLYLATLFTFIISIFLYKYLIKVGTLSSLLYLSYVLLQCFGYIFEVIWGAPPLKFVDLLNSVLFFIKAWAGPIERPHEFSKSLNFISFTPKLTQLNILMLTLGIFQMLISKNLDYFILMLQKNNIDFLSFFNLGVFRLLKIYCNFCGYSNIVSSLALMLNIEVIKNFNSPWLSKTISDFWSRWHISLTSWFKDYIYFPLISIISDINYLNNKFVIMLGSGITFSCVAIWHQINAGSILWILFNHLILFYAPKKYYPLILLYAVFLNYLMFDYIDSNNFVENIFYILNNSNADITQNLILFFIFFIIIIFFHITEKLLHKNYFKAQHIAMIACNIFFITLIGSPNMSVIYGRF